MRINNVSFDKAQDYYEFSSSSQTLFITTSERNTDKRNKSSNVHINYIHKSSMTFRAKEKYFLEAELSSNYLFTLNKSFTLWRSSQMAKLDCITRASLSLFDSTDACFFLLSFDLLSKFQYYGQQSFYIFSSLTLRSFLQKKKKETQEGGSLNYNRLLPKIHDFTYLH